MVVSFIRLVGDHHGDIVQPYPWIIIHSASADASADLSADMPEDRFIKLKILLKYSRML